jgi:hypothetical protein
MVGIGELEDEPQPDREITSAIAVPDLIILRYVERFMIFILPVTFGWAEDLVTTPSWSLLDWQDSL